MIENIQSPFFEATKNVFSLMLDLQDVSETSAENFNHNECVNICIGVTGDLTGKIVYKFADQTSLRVVNIISGMEIDSIDDFVTSAISEIANIISGNVFSILAETNIICDILPPYVSTAEDDKEYHVDKDVCIVTSVGNVCLSIKLDKSK